MSEAVAGAASAAQRDSILRLNLRRFARDRIALAAALAVALFVAIALTAPWLAPHDPYDTDLLRRLQPPAWMEGGDWRYLLGCDTLGRDILSRIIYGARISISIGVVVVLLACVAGTVLGLAAGYHGRAVDAVVSRVVDVLLAFPYLIFAIGLMGMMGPGLQNIVLALVYKEWTISCGSCAGRRWRRASTTTSRRRGR